MRFGNYGNIIGNDSLLREYKTFGFDYFEASLADIAKADDEAFEAAAAAVSEIGLPVDACNVMFPAEIRITGSGLDTAKITAYIEKAFERANRLGVKKIALGSDKSRNITEGYSEEQGYADIISVLQNCVVPSCEKHGITVVIEPLRKPPCNIINTLADGMRVVEGVNHPNIKLLADSIHVMTSGEDMEDFIRFKDSVRHVHISDWDRALPEFTYSGELTRFLNTVQRSGYDGDISFEAVGGSGRYGSLRALMLLKQKLL